MLVWLGDVLTDVSEERLAELWNPECIAWGDAACG